MMQALHFSKLEGNKVKCGLCPHHCIIKEGLSGKCKVRTNNEGVLHSENYGFVSSIGFDPIEKKPLYHFFPGFEILSFGSFGCNLQCKFCQNWQISQTCVNESGRESRFYESEQIINVALSRKSNIGIAYTYNEPIVFYEFMIHVAKKARENDLKNVMVSNGFINAKPLDELNHYMDAYNIDLKAFHENFYRQYTNSKLEPVKETLKRIVEAGKHLEITNLVIPGLNDDLKEFESMVKWISKDLGQDIVLHLSRYYPMYQLSIDATSVEKMTQLSEIAKKYLNYVYLGNVMVHDENNTYCPNCRELLITRSGYRTKLQSINKQGDCTQCGKHILNFMKES